MSGMRSVNGSHSVGLLILKTAAILCSILSAHDSRRIKVH
jgi:hypothetical protein